MARKSINTAKASSDRADIRAWQALDHATGGSGDFTPVPAGRHPPAICRPENGTDDARCEDSAKNGLERNQRGAEVLAFISCHQTGSRSRKFAEKYMHLHRVAGVCAPNEARTDAEIWADIEARLKANKVLDETSIFVAAGRGPVIIEGSVDKHETKQRAETISRQEGGMTGHDSNLAAPTSS